MLSLSCKYALRAAVLPMRIAPKGRQLSIVDVAKGNEAEEVREVLCLQFSTLTVLQPAQDLWLGKAFLKR